jgi:putative tryptophan/tyrosine transport system substrate-binding protein
MRRREIIGLLGGAVAWPLAARAGLPTTPVIGLLHAGSFERKPALFSAFRQGLKETGYVENENLAIEYRWGNGDYERLPSLAAELVHLRVTVIAAIGTPAVLAAKNATSTIPIVFNFASDPVKLGLVASLSRPGGNASGINFLSVELASKQLELVHKVVPKGSLIALLANPANPLSDILSADLETAARNLGIELHVAHSSTDQDLAEVFATLLKVRAAGLVIGTDSFIDSRIEQLAGLALRNSMPAIYQFREFVAAGGLMTYGANHAAPYHELGLYAGKVLAGANPSELPVQQSAKFELVINLKTAKRMDLVVPPQLLARADEVIE